MNVLKAHAAAVKEFRTIIPGGKISMNLNSDWYLPLDEDSELDKVRLVTMTSWLLLDVVQCYTIPWFKINSLWCMLDPT